MHSRKCHREHRHYTDRGRMNFTGGQFDINLNETLTRENWTQDRCQIIPKLSGNVGLGPRDSSEFAKWAPQSVKIVSITTNNLPEQDIRSHCFEGYCYYHHRYYRL